MYANTKPIKYDIKPDRVYFRKWRACAGGNDVYVPETAETRMAPQEFHMPLLSAQRDFTGDNSFIFKVK